MASDPQYDETFQPTPPPKRGMSTGTKVLIIILCIFGGFALLCCGGVIYVGYKFKNAVSNDAAVVKEVKEKIAEIDIPGNFQPVASMDFSLWMKMRFVVYETKGKTGSLMLMEASVPNATDKDMRQNMNQQGQGDNMRQLEIKKSEMKSFKIRGKDVEFMFSEAVDSKSKAAYRQVKGSFPAKDGGAVMLMLQLPEAEYKAVEVEKMLRAIK